MSNKLTFTFPSEDSDRGAFRASLPGLTVRLPSGENLAVKDISAGGISIARPARAPRADAVLAFDLYVGNRLFLEGLKGKLVRMTENGVAAYAFVEVSRAQEYRLDKLILSMQKQVIAARKGKK